MAADNAARTLHGTDYWTLDLPMFLTREREDFYLPMHCHDFIEINYVAEGEGMHYIGNDRMDVKRGDLFVIPVGTRHVYRPLSHREERKLIVYNCLFAQEVATRLQAALPLPVQAFAPLDRAHGAYATFAERGDEFRMLMQNMYQEYKFQQPGAEAALLSLLAQLLLTMYRSSASGSAAVSHRELAPVLEYIAVHFRETIALQTLTGLVSLSPSYLQRLFKRATGQTITEYIQHLRIEKSCELLRHTELSVQEIAYFIGYKDLKFFHRLFKIKAGVSPGQYRKSVV